jgi:hypothetical protein
MKKAKVKYFSYDKIPYMYTMIEDTIIPFSEEAMLDPDLKIAG